MYERIAEEYRYHPSGGAAEACLDLTHCGYICVVDEHSRVICETGDSGDTVFFRSASKPVQALPVFKYGLDEAYGLTAEETAVFSASHTGMPCHVRAVESILKKAGFSEDILVMKPTRPVDEAANEERIRNGLPLRRIYHNCSGKHAALLLLQRHLGGAPEHYWRADAAAYQEIYDTIAVMSECRELRTGTDGCGVPVFAAPVRHVAAAFKNLACIDTIPEEALQRAAEKNVRNIHDFPHMLRGKGYLCSILNQDENIIAKFGANGIYGFGLKKQRLGVCIKLVDGTEAAMPFLVQELLRAYGALTPAVEADLKALRPACIYNDNDLVVGERRLVHNIL